MRVPVLAVAAALAAFICAIFCALSSLLRASSCAFSSLLSGVDGVGGDGISVLRDGDFWTLLLDSLDESVVGALLVLFARLRVNEGAGALSPAFLVVVGLMGCRDGAAGALPACLIGADAGPGAAATPVCILGIVGMAFGSSRSPQPSSLSSSAASVLLDADIRESNGDGAGLALPPNFIPLDELALPSCDVDRDEECVGAAVGANGDGVLTASTPAEDIAVVASLASSCALR